jgi:colicin import membrane protein
MKGPSLQKTAVLSAGLHVTFFLLAFLVLRQSSNIVMPSPYVVSLVSPGRSVQKTAAPSSAASVRSREAAAPAAVHKKEAPGFDEKKAEKLIDERIAAIEAKHKIRKIVEIRKAIGAIQGRQGVKKEASSARNAAKGSAGNSDEAGYIDKITEQIQSHWAVPEFFMNKNLEATIVVRIGRDGALFVEGFEKKSGNRLYDKYVMDTIRKASPVIPPPQEIEMGIRFSSNDGREG